MRPPFLLLFVILLVCQGVNASLDADGREVDCVDDEPVHRNLKPETEKLIDLCVKTDMEVEHITKQVKKYSKEAMDLITDGAVFGKCDTPAVCHDVCGHLPCHTDAMIVDDKCVCQAGHNYRCNDEAECNIKEDICECKEGYEPDGAYEPFSTNYPDPICANVDECANENPCGPGADCVDTEGSYECQCEPGFTYVDNEIGCVECQVDDDCPSNYRKCEDYQCICQEGYEESDACVIIIEDECTPGTPPSGCGVNTQCVMNLSGSYECVCLAGYEGNPLAGCTNIDECADNVCDIFDNAECIDLPGDFECVCQEGYAGDPDTGCEPFSRCNFDVDIPGVGSRAYQFEFTNTPDAISDALLLVSVGGPCFDCDSTSTVDPRFVAVIAGDTSNPLRLDTFLGILDNVGQEVCYAVNEFTIPKAVFNREKQSNTFVVTMYRSYYADPYQYFPMGGHATLSYGAIGESCPPSSSPSPSVPSIVVPAPPPNLSPTPAPVECVPQPP